MRKGSGDRLAKRPWTFGWRLVRFVIMRPAFSFGILFVLVAVLALTRDNQAVRALYLLTFPWVFALLLILNSPFLASAFRQFRMSDAVKMNHALEHGTIFFLRRRYGRKFKIGGKAEEDGFRLNGLQSPEQIVSAFKELLEHLARGDSRPVVSIHCGSNIITAQGYGIVVLIISGIGLLFLPLGRQATLTILASNLVVYVLLRQQLGNLVQRRFFMSLDFQDAAIHSVNQVKPVGIERRPVFFVRTAVRRLERSAEKPNNRMQATAGGLAGSITRDGRAPAAPDAER